MGRGTAVAVLAMVAAVGAAGTAGAQGVEACPAPAGDVSGLPNPGGGVPNGYLLVNGHVPRRRRAPGGPGFRVRARAGDVLRIDYPLTACAPGGGTWFENLGTLFVIDRRARPATSRDFRVLGSSGIAAPVAIPGGVQWPYGELPAGQWAHRIVRLQLERGGRLYLVPRHRDRRWGAAACAPCPAAAAPGGPAPGPDPPQTLQGGGKPDRQSRHDPYRVQVDVGRAPRVYATACATTRQRLLVRAPSRRVARAGKPRVRLHPRKRLCSARSRLKG